jgi:hypothetical protein
MQMETVTSRDGTSIAFDRLGTGSPLVLVGGALQHRAIDPPTAQLAELLATAFAVYQYDRGRGCLDGKAPCDVERDIDDLDAVIAHARELAGVLAFSSDVVIALRAAYEGVAIRKLALYEPPFDAIPLEEWSTLNVPTLVLDGSESTPHRHDAYDLLAATLPRAERHTLAGQSHNVEPEVLAPVLVEFFSRRNGVPARDRHAARPGDPLDP